MSITELFRVQFCLILQLNFKKAKVLVTVTSRRKKNLEARHLEGRKGYHLIFATTCSRYSVSAGNGAATQTVLGSSKAGYQGHSWVHVSADSFNKSNRWFLFHGATTWEWVNTFSLPLKCFCDANKTDKGGRLDKIEAWGLKAWQLQDERANEGHFLFLVAGIYNVLWGKLPHWNQVESWRACTCVSPCFGKHTIVLEKSRSLAKRSNLVPASLWLRINPHL